MPHVARGPGAPESTCLPSSKILEANVKAGKVPFKELVRAYVTWVYLLTGQNASEIARLTGLNRKTVTRRLDLGRLARWLTGRK